MGKIRTIISHLLKITKGTEFAECLAYIKTLLPTLPKIVYGKDNGSVAPSTGSNIMHEEACPDCLKEFNILKAKYKHLRNNMRK